MDAYGDVDGGDVTKDSEETESTFMCKRCYQKLTRWNVEFQQYQKYNNMSIGLLLIHSTDHNSKEHNSTSMYIYIYTYNLHIE